MLRVRLPFRGGREQAGTRPAVLMQRDDGPQQSPTLVIVPLTSQLAATRFEPSIELDPSEGSGLRVRSVAMVYQMTAIDRVNVIEQLGTLPDADFARIRDAIVTMISPEPQGSDSSTEVR